ncbi:MAG: fumarate hydratase C-terminal domain-containing protein [Gammaproteobacteria bacterium]|nr:fumarate hydratase C-terminal domain-containing protein [Gammaproteobacteria bacterium]
MTVPDHNTPPQALGPHETVYDLISQSDVSCGSYAGRTMVHVKPQALTLLAEAAVVAVSHFYRTSHLQQLSNILNDEEASDNDRFVATELLKNAVIAAQGVLPGCQDTGTAIVMAKKGQQIWLDSDPEGAAMSDQAALSSGIAAAFANHNLRYSQLLPVTFFEEKNSGNNLPAQIDIEATVGDSYDFLFITKGGGSANKTFLFQETKALLNPASLREFMKAKLPLLGVSACPPYHLAVVVGGTSAEANLKMVKLASAHYLDNLPLQSDGSGAAFRDPAVEAEILALTQELGMGAQFGGKYFAHDVRVVRLPRHGASCPVGIGVSCSADRNILGRIDRQGIWLERLEHNPARFLPQQGLISSQTAAAVIPVDLRQPISAIRELLSRYPVTTRLALSGPIIVARDIAHAKLKACLDAGEPLPDFFHHHIIYYAGPAKQPDGLPSGSFGPTTAGRMDSYVELFQSHGASLIMLAKGNRSDAVTRSCQRYGGFYLGSIGGAAAQLAQQSIRKVEVIAFPELGMEAIYRIEVENFPAFIVVDDKGNDLYHP